MGKPDQESAAAEGARRATGDAAGRGRGGRFSVGRKHDVVLRLLRKVVRKVVRHTRRRWLDPLARGRYRHPPIARLWRTQERGDNREPV